MSVAGIARVHPEGLGRLQKMSQTFAGLRRGRLKKRPTGRDGDGSRRSLRLLLVMHLHDRHGASHPSSEAETSGVEAWETGSEVDYGSFSLRFGDGAQSTGLNGIFRHDLFTWRNDFLPWQIQTGSAATPPP